MGPRSRRLCALRGLRTALVCAAQGQCVARHGLHGLRRARGCTRCGGRPLASAVGAPAVSIGRSALFGPVWRDLSPLLLHTNSRRTSRRSVVVDVRLMIHKFRIRRRRLLFVYVRSAFGHCHAKVLQPRKCIIVFGNTTTTANNAAAAGSSSSSST